MTKMSNPCAMGAHHICDGGFTGGRCECACHMPTMHVRKPIRRAVRTSRNWVALEGYESDRAATLCGAAVTDRDVTLRQATSKRAVKEGWIRDICPNCLTVIDEEK